MTIVNLEGDDVFLVDPRHTAYVTGESPYLQDGALPWIKRIIILLLVIVSIGLFVSEFIVGDEGFVMVNAEILTLDETTTDADTIYFIVYRFQDENGNTITNEKDITREVYNRLNSAETVSIKYIPELPESATLDVEQTQFFEQVQGTLFLLIVFIAVLVYILIFWVVRPAWHNQHLETNGWLVKAKLSNAHPTTSWFNAHIVNITFHFSTPQGKTIRGSVSKQRPDLKKKSLPFLGTPMTVLYVNDRLWKIM